MRIAISTEGRDFDKFIFARFGRSPHFLFCDSEDPQGTGKFVDNPFFIGNDSLGIITADFVAKEKTEILITGQLGGNALRVVQAMNIKPYTAPETMTIREAIIAWTEGSLTEIR